MLHEAPPRNGAQKHNNLFFFMFSQCFKAVHLKKHSEAASIVPTTLQLQNIMEIYSIQSLLPAFSMPVTTVSRFSMLPSVALFSVPSEMPRASRPGEASAASAVSLPGFLGTCKGGMTTETRFGGKNGMI